MKKHIDWRKQAVSTDAVLARIEPGMSIFIGTGIAEPRTLVQALMASSAGNLQDLELIQLISFGDAVTLTHDAQKKVRLKTFFSGWVASEAIAAGRIDLIPCRFSRIPQHLSSGRLKVDIAFVQVAPPDASGYCSLGLGVDVTRMIMEQAELVVAEINPDVPFTYGDTFVPLSDFDLLVAAAHPPLVFPRWPVTDVFDRVAAHVASVIEDGACISFSIGPLFEALAKHLSTKAHLGVHSLVMTDALMELIQSGAVTNRRKSLFRGKNVAVYAFGTDALLKWLDHNPLVDFQSADKVMAPARVGSNTNAVAVLPARKADLTGRLAMHAGKGNVAVGPGEAMDLVTGAELSNGGFTIFGLPSRNLVGDPNIRLSVESFDNQFSLRESVDMVATEFGVAYLAGRTVRERAQALIDIAHPEDRQALVTAAKDANILYKDQVFIAESALFYPAGIATVHSFGSDLTVRFRAIRPSDEEAMRRLFYRFSDEQVYYRFFAPIRAMPHDRMQTYVNVNYRKEMAVVGLVGERGAEQIIAEARYARYEDRPWADVAFVVDSAVEGRGIATFLFKMLVRIAMENGIQGFTADVLPSNKGMMRVFEKGGRPVQVRMEDGTYAVRIPFSEPGHLPGGQNAT